MALFDVVIAYPGSWNTKTKNWNNNEITFYEIAADTEGAATAAIQTKIDAGEMNASVSYLLEDGGLEAKLASWNWVASVDSRTMGNPHTICPIIITTERSPRRVL